MFKYFPTNYPWNLSVDLALEMGVRIGEIEEMCAPLQGAARAPDAAGTVAFRQAFVRMADKLCALADEDKERARLLSAGEKLNRAATYLITGPGWQGEVPAGMKEIKSPTRYFLILGRTYADGTEKDYQAVNKLQAQYKITPLSAWGKPYTPSLGRPR